MVFSGFFVYKSIKTTMSYRLLRKYWDTGFCKTTYVHISNLPEPSQLIFFIDLELFIWIAKKKSLPQHSVKTSRAIKKAFLQENTSPHLQGQEYILQITFFLSCFYCIRTTKANLVQQARFSVLNPAYYQDTHRNVWLGGEHPASRTAIHCASANTRCRSNWPRNYVVFSVTALHNNKKKSLRSITGLGGYYRYRWRQQAQIVQSNSQNSFSGQHSSQFSSWLKRRLILMPTLC